jgi:2-methylisocitrate lyase-like PEP mutase family enzyme
MATLKELISRKGKVLTVMQFQTAAVARVMEQAGAEAGFIGASLVVGQNLGISDLGQIWQGEVMAEGGAIARSVKVPVIVDARMGERGILAVRRTVQDCIREGISGILLDDLAGPGTEADRGPTSGAGSVVPLDFALARFRAAVDMRDELGRPDFFIQARCVSREAPNGGLEDAFDRMVEYEKTGVDLVQFRHARDLDEVRQARARLRGPFAFAEMKGYPDFTEQELLNVGCNMAWYSDHIARLITTSVYEFVKDFQNRGLVAWEEWAKAHPNSPPRYNAPDSVQKLRQLQEKYFPNQTAKAAPAAEAPVAVPAR